MAVIGGFCNRTRCNQGGISPQILEPRHRFSWLETGIERGRVSGDVELRAVVQQAAERLPFIVGSDRRCFPTKSDIRCCPHLVLNEFPEIVLLDQSAQELLVAEADLVGIESEAQRMVWSVLITFYCPHAAHHSNKEGYD